MCSLSFAIYQIIGPVRIGSLMQLSNPSPSLLESDLPAVSKCPFADELGLNDKYKTDDEKDKIIKQNMPSSHPPISAAAKQSECPHLNRQKEKQTK